MRKLLIAALLLAPASTWAYSFRIVQGEVSDADAARISTVLQEQGHTIATALTEAELEEMKYQAVAGTIDDLSARIQQAEFVLQLRPGADGVLGAEVLSLARGTLLYAHPLQMQQLQVGLEALLSGVAAASEQVVVIGDDDQGTWVETVVRGRAKKGQPGSVARKVATMDAQRNAVEQLLGSQVNLDAVGDNRTVISEARGTLRYSIVQSGQDELGPWVEIQAAVRVPKSLTEQAPAAPKFPAESGLKPLVQEHAFGRVDWGSGVVTARGKAKTGKKAAVLARRAAIVDAQANALALIKLLALDADATVGEKSASDGVLALKLEGTVRGGSVVSEKNAGGTYEVELEVPLHGVQGVQSAFVGTVAPRSFDTAALEIPADEPTGVIIDMRGTGSVASLMPKVMDAAGTLVFDPAKDMDPHARQARGFASYAIGGQVEGLMRDGWQYIRGASVDTAGNILLAMHTDGVVADGEPVLLAQAVRRRAPARRVVSSSRARVAPRPRQGRTPQRVKARPQGRLPTNIVFSTKQSEKKSFYARLSRSLKSGRVVILADTAIGGVEGRLFQPQFAEGYFWQLLE